LDESSSFEFWMEYTGQTSLKFKIQRGTGSSKFKGDGRLKLSEPMEDYKSSASGFGMRYPEQLDE
jgi:hypothetical protein